MPTLTRYGERIALPPDAPPGAASAWRCTSSRGQLVFVDRQGRRVKGSAGTVPPQHLEHPPLTTPGELERRRQQDIAERRRWRERNSAVALLDAAAEVMGRWAEPWRKSGAGLPFDEWLLGEIERLERVAALADEMQKADRKLRRREAEERAAAAIALL